MSYIDAIIDGNEVVTWVRTPQKGLQVYTDPAPYYCYVKDDNGPYKSIYGEQLRKVTFDSWREYNQFTKSNHGLYESDIQPIYKFLSDNFYGDEDHPWNVAYFDIETTVDLNLGIGFPTPENPYGEVNSISLFDVSKKEYHLIALYQGNDLNLKNDRYKVNIHYCVTERQLLDTFIRLIEDIDVITGWNSDGYDIPYLMQRMIRTYGEHKAMQALSRNGYTTSSRQYTDRYGYSAIKYTLKGRVHLDLMELYMKFTFGERESNSLDSIAEYELGINKLPYAGDLGDLYRNNPHKFYEYSLHDTVLLNLLDEKMKLIDFARSVARQSTIKYDDVYGSIRPLEQAIRNYCHFDRKEKVILPDRDTEKESETFPGGWVMEPKIGVYGWVSTVDLSALYPSTIRALNISPESYMFQCKGKHKDFIEVLHKSDKIIELQDTRTKEIVNIPAKDLSEFIRNEGLSISAWGSIFTRERGILPEVLDLWVTERTGYQKKQRMYAREAERIKKKFGID